MDTIEVTLPLEVAKELSKMTETFAPLVKAIAIACSEALENQNKEGE